MEAFYQLLKARRMCRAYQDRPVSTEMITKVLEAARRSPSAGHAQGWRIGVVTDSARRLAVAHRLGENEYMEKGFEPWLSVAPVHLFVGTEPGAYLKRYGEPDKTSDPATWPLDYAVLDAGKALMTLYLAAQAEGLACGYLGPHRAQPAIELVPWPSTWRFLGLVTMGYPDWERQRASRSHARGWRHFDSVVRWWDEAR